MSQKITAKVKVFANVENYGGQSRVVTFGADYADGRNKEWAEATPSLNLTMVVKSDLTDAFKPGTPFTLTFEADEQ